MIATRRRPQDQRPAADARTGDALTNSATLAEPANGDSPVAFSYSFVWRSDGDRVCSHSVQITTPVNGGRQKVIEEASGDCESVKGPAKTVPSL